ncbi:MAG: Asp-tRNA(Asn)/Glu-tRNA(Gln) amidotransferase subunit GatC [Candidatus Kerfeldbacteria bacterium]|nr:Asp-tRNA(Asn)/Glu-tRNA(Gln) amidotransferase subunit GatC [Candidatus Kerfeldbacteria bacterium]
MKSNTDVESLASLARLDLRADETRQFATQVNRILDYVGQLQALADLPLAPPSVVVTTWRQDQPAVSRAIELILAAAPDRLDRYWRVPAVFA